MFGQQLLLPSSHLLEHHPQLLDHLHEQVGLILSIILFFGRLIFMFE